MSAVRLKHFLVGGAVVAACATGVGIAVATHVPQVDPATVPPGFLATHSSVQNLARHELGIMADRRRLQVFVQHIQVPPNEALPWHSHPGPAVVTVVKGALTYQDAVRGVCRQKTYLAGTGFVDRGFGHVHRAIAGPEGFDSYVTYLLGARAQTHIILADAPRACVP